MSDTKEATLGQGRAHFPFGDSVTKAGSSEKSVIRKSNNSRVQFPIWSSVTKAGSARKVVIGKSNNSGPRGVYFPNWMKVDDKETSFLCHTC